MLDQSIDHGLRVFAGHPDQHDVARAAFNERGNLTVVAAHEVATHSRQF